VPSYITQIALNQYIRVIYKCISTYRRHFKVIENVSKGESSDQGISELTVRHGARLGVRHSSDTFIW
jgi:hypothetical protein